MRKIGSEWWQPVVGLAVAAVIVVGGGALVAASSAQAAQSRPSVLTGTDPPECNRATITTGSTVYDVLWCGTGADGEPPLKPAVTGLIDDGGSLSFVGCGNSWVNPCVILWPNSPVS